MPTTDLILYQFSRDRVEAGDAKDFLSRFGNSSLPTGKKLESMMNSVALMIDGYNHDPREIYAIPEVRAFSKQLWKVWPYWLYFCNLDSENLKMMVMCCLDSLDALKIKGQSQVKVSLSPVDIVRFISAGFVPINEMCERAGMSEHQVFERTKAGFEHFNLPFDAPPPCPPTSNPSSSKPLAALLHHEELRVSCSDHDGCDGPRSHSLHHGQAERHWSQDRFRQQGASAVVFIVESWITKTKADEPLDTLTPPS